MNQSINSISLFKHSIKFHENVVCWIQNLSIEPHTHYPQNTDTNSIKMKRIKNKINKNKIHGIAHGNKHSLVSSQVRDNVTYTAQNNTRPKHKTCIILKYSYNTQNTILKMVRWDNLQLL
jgi:ribosomal protein L25 (general stress protein Ctc)